MMKTQEYQRSRIGLILIIAFLIALLGFWVPAQAKALDLLDLTTPQVASETKISPEVQEALDTAAGGDMITVIVTMRSQADLSKIGGKNRQTRNEQVIRALQNQANATQQHLRGAQRHEMVRHRQEGLGVLGREDAAVRHRQREDQDAQQVGAQHDEPELRGDA